MAWGLNLGTCWGERYAQFGGRVCTYDVDEGTRRRVDLHGSIPFRQ
jgi:hypothetical protein